MGLGYEQLRPANEGLIYCSITGFGPDGPHSKRYSALPYKSVNLSPAPLINWCHLFQGRLRRDSSQHGRPHARHRGRGGRASQGENLQFTIREL